MSTILRWRAAVHRASEGREMPGYYSPCCILPRQGHGKAAIADTVAAVFGLAAKIKVAIHHPGLPVHGELRVARDKSHTFHVPRQQTHMLLKPRLVAPEGDVFVKHGQARIESGHETRNVASLKTSREFVKRRPQRLFVHDGFSLLQAISDQPSA